MHDLYLVTWPEKITPERSKALGLPEDPPETITASAIVPRTDALAFARQQAGARVFHIGPEIPVPEQEPDRSVRKHGRRQEQAEAADAAPEPAPAPAGEGDSDGA